MLAFCTTDWTCAEKGSLSLRPLTCQAHSDVPIAPLVFKCTPEFPGLAIAHCHENFTRAVAKDAGYLPITCSSHQARIRYIPQNSMVKFGNSLN